MYHELVQDFVLLTFKPPALTHCVWVNLALALQGWGLSWGPTMWLHTPGGNELTSSGSPNLLPLLRAMVSLQSFLYRWTNNSSWSWCSCLLFCYAFSLQVTYLVVLQRRLPGDQRAETFIRCERLWREEGLWNCLSVWNLDFTGWHLSLFTLGVFNKPVKPFLSSPAFESNPPEWPWHTVCKMFRSKVVEWIIK